MHRVSKAHRAINMENPNWHWAPSVGYVMSSFLIINFCYVLNKPAYPAFLHDQFSFFVFPELSKNKFGYHFKYSSTWPCYLFVQHNVLFYNLRSEWNKLSSIWNNSGDYPLFSADFELWALHSWSLVKSWIICDRYYSSFVDGNTKAPRPQVTQPMVETNKEGHEFSPLGLVDLDNTGPFFCQYS